MIKYVECLIKRIVAMENSNNILHCLQLVIVIERKLSNSNLLHCNVIDHRPALRGTRVQVVSWCQSNLGQFCYVPLHKFIELVQDIWSQDIVHHALALWLEHWTLCQLKRTQFRILFLLFRNLGNFVPQLYQRIPGYRQWNCGVKCKSLLDLKQPVIAQ